MSEGFAEVQEMGLPSRPRVLEDRKCPKCGSILLTNGMVVWCSFIGGRNASPCDYGIERREPLIKP